MPSGAPSTTTRWSIGVPPSRTAVAVYERTLGDDDAVAGVGVGVGVGVGEEVLDLIARRRVVDRERNGTQVHGSQVHEMELRPVGEHDANRVPAFEAQRRETSRDAPHPLGESAVSERDTVISSA